jgi:acetyl-CoA C-acetyltransferase
MTACIVGWAHLPFGKHDNESVESLIVKAARARSRPTSTRSS